MTWTPETIAAVATAITGGLMIGAGVLYKYDLFPGKNKGTGNGGNSFSGKSISQIENLCQKKHQVIEDKFDDVFKVQAKQEVCIEHSKGRLDKGEEKFMEFQKDISTINTNVAVIKERINQQYDHMTGTMSLILEKLKD